jgi:hypothetical protein
MRKRKGAAADLAKLGCDEAGLKLQRGKLAGPLVHGLRRRVGLTRRKGEWGEEGNLFIFSKATQTNEFKLRFDLKHPKQSTSMNATGNSYILFIN